MPLALLPLLAFVSGPSSGAGVFPPPWPGLPSQPLPDGAHGGQWIGAWGDGLSEVARAQQWVKIPAQAVAAGEIFLPEITYPPGNPQNLNFISTTDASIYLSSPKGTKEGYGIGLPVTLHTVAFGSIPIQVGVQLEQVRDAQDLPIPLTLSATETAWTVLQQVRPGVTSQDRVVDQLTGQVRVRLTALAVDGVDLGLQDCVSAPIDLKLHGNPLWGGDPATDVTLKGFAVGSQAWTNWLAARGIATIEGGAFDGDIDIPAFAHCLTKTGEDLSPLLTSAVSGPGNPVTVGTSAISSMPDDAYCSSPVPGLPGWKGPRAPFSGDPSDCNPAWGPPTLDYPKPTS